MSLSIHRYFPLPPTSTWDSRAIPESRWLTSFRSKLRRTINFIFHSPFRTKHEVSSEKKWPWISWLDRPFSRPFLSLSCSNPGVLQYMLCNLMLGAPHANFEFNVLVRCFQRITIITSNLTEKKKLEENIASSKTSSTTPDVQYTTWLYCSFLGICSKLVYIPIVFKINFRSWLKIN